MDIRNRNSHLSRFTLNLPREYINSIMGDPNYNEHNINVELKVNGILIPEGILETKLAEYLDRYREEVIVELDKNKSIDYLISKYLEDGLREEAKRDLALLMEYENEEYLGYRVYTPSFNDGDICEFTVLFFDKINRVTPCGDYYLSMDSSTGELIVSDAYDLENPEQYRDSCYKTFKWRRLIEKIAPLVVDTNTEGIIKRVGNTVEIIGIQSYYDDY